MPRARLIALVCFALTLCAPAAAHAAIVGAAGSVTTIRPADAVTPSAGSITVSAARNEFASLQIAVRANAGALAGVSIVQAGAFTGPGGATLPASATSIYREDYYTVTTPSDGEAGSANPCSANCRWPDALIPSVDPIYGQTRNAWPADIPAGENRVAWIDVLVPQGQTPGMYSATFEARQGAAVLGSVSVQLQVVDFTLPSTSSLQGTFALDWHNVCRTWGGNGNDCSQVPGGIWAMYSSFVRLGLDNRISISGPAYAAPTPGNMASFDQYALPYINGTGPTKLPGARLATVLLNRWEDWAMGYWRTKANAAGFVDRVTFYCDEVAQNSATWNDICNTPFATAQTNWANAGGGGPATLPSAIIGTQQDMQYGRAQGYPITAQNGSLQTLIPLVTRMHTGPECCDAPNWWGAYPGQTFWGNQRSLYDAFLGERPSNRLWLYTSCMTEGCGNAYDGHVRYSGWPSYAIDQAEGESRSMAWQVFNYKATGEYYYETTKRMDTAFTAGGQLEDGGNGDGTLFYPGKVNRIGGQTDTILESMRLKRIREGREDYELLAWLAANGKLAEARAVAGGPYSANADAGLFSANAMYDSAHPQGEWDSARSQLEALVTGQQVDPGPAPVTCNGKAATIVIANAGQTTLGTPGDDVIVGTSGEDNIYAGAGNDTICGLGGYDTIRPGTGSDWVDGGSGADAGENAIDYSQETHGVSVNLATGVGDMTDHIQGFNEVFGSIYDDTLIGDSAYNFLAGNMGDDRLEGAGGDDLFWGREGNDTIIPGSGRDRVLADDGADMILARDGEADDIACGAGVDAGERDLQDTVNGDCEALALPAVAPEPLDVCTNIDGLQSAVPSGMQLSTGQCVQIPAPVDVCTNLAGTQSTVPEGMYSNTEFCLPKTRPRLVLRQLTSSGSVLACGATPARPCRARATSAVRMKLLAVSPAALAGRPVTVHFQRLVGHTWKPAFTLGCRLDQRKLSLITKRLGISTWRVNAQIGATSTTLGAISTWQYVRVTR
jgi:hypothetical protein